MPFEDCTLFERASRALCGSFSEYFLELDQSDWFWIFLSMLPSTFMGMNLSHLRVNADNPFSALNLPPSAYTIEEITKDSVFPWCGSRKR
jgi:hypothetical protein